jgi:hypothetical protein
MRQFFFFLFFTLVIYTPAKAQLNSELQLLRSQYYVLGMSHSVKQFDSSINQLVSKRQQQKLNEVDFLNQYERIEQDYKNQHLLVANIAAQWAILQRQRPSKLIKSSLDLIKKGKATSALASLEGQAKNLGKLELEFLSNLCLWMGKLDKAKTYTNPQIKDSLASIWTKRYDAIDQLDTSLFVRQKIYVAEQFVNEKQMPSGIATLLRAQEWQNKIKDQSIEQQKTSALIALRLSQWQLQMADVNNAIINAQICYNIYTRLIDENVQEDYAAALQQMAAVYRVGGASKESDSLYKRALKEYDKLILTYPEKYEPLYAAALQEHSIVLRYFDRFKEYDQSILDLIALRTRLSKTNYPFFQIDLAKNYSELGHKLMNTDVKIFLAQDEWTKAKLVLEPLYKRLPFMTGNDLCGVLYKLGGAKIALKKGADGIPFFAESLKIRTNLYHLAPSIHQRDYLDILTQNATLNALNNKREISVLQLEQAIKVAKELGETKRLEEIEKFQKDVQTH